VVWAHGIICRVFHLRTPSRPAEEDMPAIMSSFKKFNDSFMEQYQDYSKL
jgi:glutamate--glyoxylate aminotransferase